MDRLIRSLTALAVTAPGPVARGGEFQFVSPGDQTRTFYDPPDTRDTVQNLGGEVRTAPQDFVRDTGITYPSIYNAPGRSLLSPKGYPRNVVPSTIVLDRQHRVAAVFLTALHEADLRPVVARIAAEPRTSAER